MNDTKESWFKRNYDYLQQTISPANPADSKFRKLTKKAGFIMFFILLVCTVGALLLSISFVH